jgi:hypothetical protein
MSKVYKDVCPCKDCGERKTNCHSVCKKYGKWTEEGVEIEKKPYKEFVRFTKQDFKKREKKRYER